MCGQVWCGRRVCVRRSRVKCDVLLWRQAVSTYKVTTLPIRTKTTHDESHQTRIHRNTAHRIVDSTTRMHSERFWLRTITDFKEFNIILIIRPMRTLAYSDIIPIMCSCAEVHRLFTWREWLGRSGDGIVGGLIQRVSIYFIFSSHE